VHEPPKLEGIPADLAEVLASCLSKDPAERPTAREIAERVAPAAGWLPETVLDDIARREAELNAWLEVTAADPLWGQVPGDAAAGFDTVADSALDVANTPTPRMAQASGIGSRRRDAADLPPRTAGLRASETAADVVPQPEQIGSTPDPGTHNSPTGRTRQPRTSAAQTASTPDPSTQPERNSPADRPRRPGPQKTSAEYAAALPPALPRFSATKPGAAYAAFLLDPHSEPTPETAATSKPPPAPATTTASTATPATPATHHRAPRRRRFPVYAALGALLGAAITAVIVLLPHSGHSAPPPPQGPATISSPAASSAAKPKAAPPTRSGEGSGLGQRTGATSASGSRR
jgi:hypothetical protein